MWTRGCREMDDQHTTMNRAGQTGDGSMAECVWLEESAGVSEPLLKTTRINAPSPSDQ